MSYGLAYVICFVGGPLLMLLLTRQAGSDSAFVIGVAAVVALIAGALFARQSSGLAAVGMLWLAWVGTISVCVRVAMRRVHTQRGLAVTKALGAMATVVPWLGLALAEMMRG